jgi:ribosome-associated translation inhibitor RaiA
MVTPEFIDELYVEVMNAYDEISDDHPELDDDEYTVVNRLKKENKTNHKLGIALAGVLYAIFHLRYGERRRHIRVEREDIDYLTRKYVIPALNRLSDVYDSLKKRILRELDKEDEEGYETAIAETVVHLGASIINFEDKDPDVVEAMVLLSRALLKLRYNKY